MGGSVEFHVTDAGPGFPAEFLPRAFDRFSRADEARGRGVTTIEGIAPAPGELSPIQDAFCETHGMQCGYCTPAMILTAHALLANNPAPSRAEIVAAISANLCRCTGYAQIIEAVALAAERMRGLNRPASVT